MSKIIIPEELYTSIKTVIKYQNILLLKEISQDNGWKYIDLKKKYLKTNDIQELVNYSNKQKKKIKIKKNAKKKSLDEKNFLEKSLDQKSQENEVAKNFLEKSLDQKSQENEVANEVANEVENEVANEVANITLSINTEEEEIECHKYTYMDKEYYVNIKSNNVYNIESEFIGRMINGILNLDEEEI